MVKISDFRSKKFFQEDMDLDKIFQKNVEQTRYYDQVKKGYLNDKEKQDTTHLALMNYHLDHTDYIGGVFKAPQLEFLHFSNNVLCFFNKGITMA